MGVGILRILSDDNIEVGNRSLMVFDHLVGLGSFMHITEIARHPLDTLAVREDGLLELFKATVCESQVIVDVRLVRHERVMTEGSFHHSDAFFILLEGKVSQTLLVE